MYLMPLLVWCLTSVALTLTMNESMSTLELFLTSTWSEAVSPDVQTFLSNLGSKMEDNAEKWKKKTGEPWYSFGLFILIYRYVSNTD